MAQPNVKKLLVAYRLKVGGEVRFIKDRSGDPAEWGWGSPGPTDRAIQEDFIFNPRYLKPLALTLRSSLMALGHVTSAHARFVKIKSRNVSPDGALGGKGYIQKIPDMRRQLMNVIEALSALTDTLHDEMGAPHWDPAEDTLDSRDREEVKEIVEDAEEIREDPEGWAAEKEEDMAEESDGKKASVLRVVHRYSRQSAQNSIERDLLRVIEASVKLKTSISTAAAIPTAVLERDEEVANLVGDMRAAGKCIRLVVESVHV